MAHILISFFWMRCVTSFVTKYIGYRKANRRRDNIFEWMMDANQWAQDHQIAYGEVWKEIRSEVETTWAAQLGSAEPEDADSDYGVHVRFFCSVNNFVK